VNLLPILIGAALALACSAEEPEPPPPVPQVAAPSPDGRIDPTPYREELEAVEDLLNGAPELTDETRKQLAEALLALHNEIVFNDSSLGARETSGRFFVLSARVDATPEALRGEREMQRLRQLWSELCAEQFSPADWLDAH
jgi:hypothetical protein